MFTKASLLTSILAIALLPQMCEAKTAPLSEQQQAEATIKTSPQTLEQYQKRAEAFGQLGQYKKQINDLTSAINLSPQNSKLFAKRAKAHYNLGELQNAIDDTNTANKLAPSSSSAYWTAANAYEELRLHDKAIEARTKIIELEPEHACAWDHRSILYELTKKHELAKADRLKAIKFATPKESVEMQIRSPLISNNIKEQLKGKTIILPFKYDSCGHICVFASVNDHPLQLMLDTGCSSSDLWIHAMKGVATADKAKIQRTNANGEAYQAGWFKAKSLKLANMTLANVALEVNKGLPEHKTLSGFLGGNILKNFVVTIDYSKKMVVLSDSVEQSGLKNATVVPMILRGNRPHCEVTVDGKVRALALLDTGGNINMSADSIMEPILQRKLQFNDRITGPWLGTMFAELYKFQNLKIGSTIVDPFIVHLFQAKDAPAAAGEIMLYNSFLSRFESITFDYPGRQIILEPRSKLSNSAISLLSEAHFYFLQNKQKQAIDCFTKAMKLDKELASNCYAGRAVSYFVSNQLNEALADVNRSIQIEPSDINHYFLRSQIYREQKKYNLQLADLTLSVRMWPTYKPVYLERAKAYDKLHRHKLAERDRRKAKQMD